ncbi:MAG TPA: serine kinase, partial [Rhodospirillum rubrum]|nr:serine kinase [Rhodospirillum rubrum]
MRGCSAPGRRCLARPMPRSSFRLPPSAAALAKAKEMTGATVFGDVSGWRYRGALVPPGAVAVDGADDADITVTLGPPAAAPPETGPGHPVWRRAEDGRTLLSLPGIGRFHIEGGDRVGIEAAEGADPVTLGLSLIHI